MPPLKATAAKKSTVTTGTENSIGKTMHTRYSKGVSSAILRKENIKDMGPFPKRKAVSPIKGNTMKRSALGNITNAIETQCVITSGKNVAKRTVSSTVTKPTIATTAKTSLTITTKTATSHVKRSTSPSGAALKPKIPPIPKSRLTLPAKVSTISQPKSSLNGSTLKSTATASISSRPPSVPVVKAAPAIRPITKNPSAVSRKPPVVQTNKCTVTAKPKCMVSNVPHTRRSSGRRSTLDSSDGSLYMSALSEVLDEEGLRLSIAKSEPLPKPLVNIDEEYINDPYQCAIYTYEIFEYLKSREGHFKIQDYIEMQTSLSQHIRAVVVDWMVEIQENFELNHETLYLGVKLMDCYLSKVKVSKPSLQLISAASMFIASKYDERIPPTVEDFLFICDGAYKRKDILKAEVNILKAANFELGFPLSYRFLRRYARCAKASMPLLTLARFILEFTLMDYSTILLSDSKLAAAALYLSFKMKKELQWDDTLIYFSGYRVKDFIDIVYQLNNILHQKPRTSLSTVRNKYSHKIFHEVAKIPLLSNEEL